MGESLYESVPMFDTSPLILSKGETKPFLHVDLADSKTLESLFDLHPSLETSFDLTEFVTSTAPEVGVVRETPVAADSVVLTATVASSPADLLTLSSAATSQHLAEIERRDQAATHNFVSLPSQVPVTTTPSRHHRQQPQQQQQQQPAPQQLQGYPQSSLSPSLTVDDVSQALSDDSCVFMPEYEQLPPAITSASTSSGGWGAGAAGDAFFSTVKTEDLGLTACSLEANLPGYTPTHTPTTSSPSFSSSDMVTKMEVVSGLYGDSAGGGRYGGAGLVGGACGGGPVSPAHSMRTLSESSTATTSTIPDSPRRSSSSKGGGTKRRQVPKGSEEYKEKRARNNVAVRKSRAKAKEKQRMTESRVKELADQNEQLQKKVEMLTKELTVLRGLFVNVGAQLPDDFAKILEGGSS